jgi:hypothetical protein
MEQDKEINGTCPLCGNYTEFRELTFTENLTSIASFFGGFISGGLSNKVNRASGLVADISDSRSFPNYKCNSCHGEVMQCSNCLEIMPYNDFGSSHICRNTDKKDNVKTEEFDNDILSQLERLGALREKGLLTNDEFELQKQKILRNT